MKHLSVGLGCAGHKERQETFIRVHSAPVTKLLIVTSVPPHGCTHPKGDLNSLLSILNKQDYARWHSYEFHVSTRATEPSLRPAGSPDVRLLSVGTLRAATRAWLRSA